MCSSVASALPGADVVPGAGAGAVGAAPAAASRPGAGVSAATGPATAAFAAAVPAAAARTAAPITAADVCGCRHRAVLRRLSPGLGATPASPAEDGTLEDATPASTSAAPESAPENPGAEHASAPAPRRITGAARPRMRIAADLERSVDALARRLERESLVAAIAAQLPTQPRFGERRWPTRVDIEPGPVAVEHTLEAMAAGTRLIVGAQLSEGALAGGADILVRADSGYGAEPSLAYTPVIVCGSSVTRPARSAAQADCTVVSVEHLSLGTPAPVPLRHRTSAADSQRAAIAHVVLAHWGMASGTVGFIGRPGDVCVLVDASRLLPGLAAALAQPVPSAPTRVKECRSCEFHNHCRAQLLQRGDISLLLPGDRNRKWRERGVHTLAELEAAGAGEASALAGAWRRGEVALVRPREQWRAAAEPTPGGLAEDAVRAMPASGDGAVTADGPAHDASPVEIDVDMEAHPDRGTFLWGTHDGHAYRAFADFSPGGDGGRHVAEFWAWLAARRAEARAAGRRCVTWVYAAQGENHWLRHYAQRYGGTVYAGSAATGGEPVVMPTPEEVEAFIASADWRDQFAVVRRALVGTDSLGLKTVAPLAGFTFSQEGVDGKAAVHLFERALSPDPVVAAGARRTLERYNQDDCAATRAVRAWLRRGAPGIRSTVEAPPAGPS